jgi:hypothetical protein
MDDSTGSQFNKVAEAMARAQGGATKRLHGVGRWKVYNAAFVVTELLLIVPTAIIWGIWDAITEVWGEFDND